MDQNNDMSLELSSTMDFATPYNADSDDASSIGTTIIIPPRSRTNNTSSWSPISYLFRFGPECDVEIWQIRGIIMRYVVGCSFHVPRCHLPITHVMHYQIPPDNQQKTYPDHYLKASKALIDVGFECDDD